MSHLNQEGPVSVEVISYVPSEYHHCQHCEVTWQALGLGQKVHKEQRDSGLPEDLAEEFESLCRWAWNLPERFGSRVTVRLVDAASIEGFFKSLLRRFRRYPAFFVEGKRYVGCDFSRVDELISAALTARAAGS
jgi:hypothetical protein